MTTLAAKRTKQPFDDLREQGVVAFDHPLARHTWFRIGGPAKYFAQPRSVEELQEVARRCEEHAVPVYVLGLGANLLVNDDGVPGMVVHLGEDYWREVTITRNDDGTARVLANAGADVQKLVLRTCREGLTGLECMAGIPGTVGGAVRMNAGGKFGDFGSRVVRVTVMDAAGNVFDRTKDDLRFEYRRSNIVAPYILSAELELTEDDPEACAKRTKEIWMYKQNSQPLHNKSAGCMFKNPPHPAQGSAGSLIDKAGLKGFRVGNAEVSDKHANFIVAHPGCTAADVMNLVAQVRDKVRQVHGVELEREVKVWP